MKTGKPNDLIDVGILRVSTIERGSKLTETSMLHPLSSRSRRWKKSRTATVLSDPRISTVEAFAFSREHHFMLSASVTYGVASRSDPFSGKVSSSCIILHLGGELLTPVFSPFFPFRRSRKDFWTLRVQSMV